MTFCPCEAGKFRKLSVITDQCVTTTTYDICRSCEDETEELSVKHLLCVCSRLF